MFKKKIKRKPPDPAKDSQTALELHEMQLEKMDFEIVKKILSDHLAEDVIPEPEDEVQADDRYLELVVRSLDDGLKKASELLDVSIKEIKYSILEKLLKNEDGEIVEYQRIEFRLKRVSGKTRVMVTEDKLAAYFSIVFPKTENGTETDYDILLKKLTDKKVVYGIQHGALKDIITKLRDNYDALSNVTAAKGKAPVDGVDCKVVYSLFPRVKDVHYRESYGKYLQELLDGTSLKRVREEYFPVMWATQGELLVSTTEPGEGIAGKDVYGNVIKASKGRLLYRTGKNVIVKFEEGHLNYYAETPGYLEYDDGKLSVHPPLWVSEDWMEACYIGLPPVDGKIKKFTSEELHEQIKERGITYGVDSGMIEKIIQAYHTGEKGLYIKPVAAGEREKKGDDARIELFFESEVQPGKILEDGRMDYREIDTVKTVKAHQLIAVKHHAREGVPGKNLKGEVIPGPGGEDIQFSGLNNVKTITKKDKSLFYSTIEGRVVLVGDSGISVNQQYEIKGNVDFSTGNVEFNGDINIKGSVVSGFRVKAEGNIFIGGMVNQDVELVSKGNIYVKQGVLGKDYNTKLAAKGDVMAQYMQGVTVNSGGDVEVRDYIMNSFVKAVGKVITPDREKSTRGTGSIVGGEIISMKGVIANSIGSDLSKMTKIMVGVDYEFDKKIKNFNKGLDYCDSAISKLSKALKLGFNDMSTLKERISKLPREKQAPFVNSFKKLNEIGQLRNDILSKREQLVKSTDELSKKAEIVIKKELFPRVIIQIGEVKLNSHHITSGTRLKVSRDRKKIDFLKL